MSSVKVKKRKYSVLLTALLLVLVGYFLATLIEIRGDIKNQLAENAALSAAVKEQLAENKELEALVNSEDKDAYIERLAREKYGYAGKGERVYFASDVS